MLSANRRSDSARWAGGRGAAPASRATPSRIASGDGEAVLEAVSIEPEFLDSGRYGEFLNQCDRMTFY